MKYLFIFLLMACAKTAPVNDETRGMSRHAPSIDQAVRWRVAKSNDFEIYGRRSHAVVIGINDYRYDNASLPDLQELPQMPSLSQQY